MVSKAGRVEGNGGRELHTPVSRLLVLLLRGDRYERRRISKITANSARLMVASSLFKYGGTLPLSAVHPIAREGNVIPDLTWSEEPPGPRSSAVTMYDPDAPTTVSFAHWVLFDI